LWERDEYGSFENESTELSQHEATEYVDKIRNAMKFYAQPEDTERGFMGYYRDADSVNEKVRSLSLDVEIHGDKLWAVATLDLTEPLTPEELETLRDYITGQYSDGWGEGFEQQEIKVEDGDLYVHLWKRDKLFIDTQEQFAQRLGISLPPDALSQQDADDGSFAELRQRLIDRAQQNWDDFRNVPLLTTSENIYHQAIKVVARRDANIFMKDYDGFTVEQINCLLQFADPVDLVAGYLDPQSDIEDMPGILANIMDEQENFKQHYALAADPSAPSLGELEQRLRNRIEENFSIYKRDMLDSGKDELFNSASEIAAVSEIYEYMTQTHIFKETEVDFLLKFQNPLEVLSDGRNAGLYDVSDAVDWVCGDQERILNQRGYELAPDESVPVSAAPGQPPRMTVANGEKPSVMALIRQSQQNVREHSAAHKDTPDRKKLESEL